HYTDTEGQQQSLHIGSYGVGITRVMGVIVEKFADDRGIVWPEAVAPYKLHVVQIGNSGEVVSAAENLCDKAQSWGVSVLYDDTDKRPGEKFADADLLGMPHRVVVSEKTLEAGKFEYKRRTETETSMVSIEELEKLLTS
ncbi:prolyl-tRNA synthetase, partial [Candidatus Saccharibacteria bacterium]|nr:prolyl-tRNA synthetase [Candidatus Saccharibacteria bacterium]